MRFLLLIIACLGIVLMAESCKKECHDKSNPDCENYDPCYGKEKTNADFTIEEMVAGRGFETDEIHRNSKVRFNAIQEFESYEWIVGNHVDTFRTKNFVLGGFPEGQSFTVRLIGKRKPNTRCFPDDSGIDTVFKTFKVTANDSLLPIYGQYEGYYDKYPDKKVTVNVWRTTRLFGSIWEVDDTYFLNLPVEGAEVHNIFTIGASAWYVNIIGDDGKYSGYKFQGYVCLLPDKKTLKAEYSHWDTASRYPNLVRINGSFTGTRK